MSNQNENDHRPEGDAPPADAIVAQLEQVEEAVVQQEESWASRVAALEGSLEETRKVNWELSANLEAVREELDDERERTRASQERAARLADYLKQIHRLLFGGNIYHLILQACITITGATRGLYLTWSGNASAPRIRAAIGAEGYPEGPPSPFLIALCKTVLENRETLVCNELNDTADLPEPTYPGERFRNCALAPVLLQRNFDGILLVADKREGEFDEQDLDALLSIGGQAAVALENAQLQRDLQHAYLSTIAILADAVEAKDPYTHGHCEMASRYARLTSLRLGLSEEELSVVCYAALLHDVGKIGVSDGILNKPGPLLPEERELVRAHVRVGYDLIRSVPVLEAVAEAVLHHHEWYDGTGYPDGLTGDQIPFASRIISVVDAYGAMITKRSYKEAYTEEYARKELQRASGTQFDPAVVDAFLAMLDSPEAHDPEEEPLTCGVLPGFPVLRERQAYLPVEGSPPLPLPAEVE